MCIRDSQYSESVTTIYAGTTEATFEIAKANCTVDHACDGYSESYPVVPTFTEYAGKKPTGTLGNKTTMSIEFNDITPCSSQLNSNTQNAIIVDSNELAPIYRADAKHYERDGYIVKLVTSGYGSLETSLNETECEQWATDNTYRWNSGSLVTNDYERTGCGVSTGGTGLKVVRFNTKTDSSIPCDKQAHHTGDVNGCVTKDFGTCRDKAECESSCTTADEQCEGYTLDYTAVTEVAAGDEHTCALFNTGAVKCFGSEIVASQDTNNIGDAASEMGNYLVPIELGEEAMQVSSGDQYACALLESGPIKCWGQNGHGNLGVDDSIDSKTPQVALLKGEHLVLDGKPITSPYKPTNTTYSGTSCADTSACGTACDADNACEGYTGTMSAVTFSDKVVVAQNANGVDDVQSVYAADIDGDGNMDVLSASQWHGHKIMWHKKVSATAFSSYTITSNLNGAQSVYAADIDGDGDMDVLAAGAGLYSENPKYSSAKVEWYENDGQPNPTFTIHTIADDLLGYEAVRAADLDGDGDMDIISVSGDNKVRWYKNNGQANPSFTTHAIYNCGTGNLCHWYSHGGTQYIRNTGGADWSLDTVDIDGDGDIDIITAETTLSAVRLFKNDGAGSFTAQVVDSATPTGNAYPAAYWTGLNQPWSVSSGDIDGDGDIDIVVSCYQPVSYTHLTLPTNREV